MFTIIMALATSECIQTKFDWAVGENFLKDMYDVYADSKRVTKIVSDGIGYFLYLCIGVMLFWVLLILSQFFINDDRSLVKITELSVLSVTLSLLVYFGHMPNRKMWEQSQRVRNSILYNRKAKKDDVFRNQLLLFGQFIDSDANEVGIQIFGAVMTRQTVILVLRGFASLVAFMITSAHLS